MEYTEEIKETLIKINDFIQANNDVNYKIRLLEREVPNLQELVKKLTIPNVVGQSEQLNAFVDWWHNLSQDELAWYEGRYVGVFLSL
jgi:hypothetical protein